MTKTLEHYFTLSLQDRRQINISFEADIEKKDFWQYFKHKSNCISGANGYNCQSEEMFLTPLNKKKYPQNETCLCPPDNVTYIADQERRLSGVVGFVESKGGERIADIAQAQKGDFVQFWYPNSWGHCGVLQSVDTVKQTFTMHSSFPSTDGYGIQTFRYNEQTILYIGRLSKTEKQ